MAHREFELKPQPPGVRAAAKAATEAVGAPVAEWNNILIDARPRAHERTLDEARQQDERDLSEDTSYLRRIQQDLDRIEAEHGSSRAVHQPGGTRPRRGMPGEGTRPPPRSPRNPRLRSRSPTWVSRSERRSHHVVLPHQLCCLAIEMSWDFPGVQRPPMLLRIKPLSVSGACRMADRKL